MTLPYPEIAGRIFHTPLMVHPGKAAAIVHALGPRLLGASNIVTNVEAVQAGGSMGLLGDPLERRIRDDEAFDQVGPVAIIPIEGTLVHKGRWVGASSGQTSYEGIRRQVQAAMNEPSVQGVVLEVDSYGGEVAGAFDAAESIYELAQVKPVIAILTDFAYSAGYLMASAASQIIVPETGGAGSIGVVVMHTDYSQALEKHGIDVTILAAGAKKAEANQFEPLPEHVAKELLEELETNRELFARTVARYRGKARLTFDAAMKTEAGVFQGQKAVAAGIADDVGRPTTAFKMFVDEIAGQSPV